MNASTNDRAPTECVSNVLEAIHVVAILVGKGFTVTLISTNVYLLRVKTVQLVESTTSH